MVSTFSFGKCKFNKVNKLLYVYFIVPMTSAVQNTLSFLRRLKTCIKNFLFFHSSYVPGIYQLIYIDTLMYWLQSPKIKFVLTPLCIRTCECVCVCMCICTYGYTYILSYANREMYPVSISMHTFIQRFIYSKRTKRDFFSVLYFLCKFLNTSLHWGRDLVIVTVHLHSELFQ